MKILITGGAGFIGSHLAEALLNRGDVVYIIDNFSTGRAENIEHLRANKNFCCIVDTIMNFNVLSDLIEKCDIVFHLAAAVGVKLIVDNPTKALEINIKGTELLLESAAKRNRLVVLVSTSEVYGKNNNVPFKEDSDIVLGSPVGVRWGYACSKLVGEFLALSYYRERGLPVIIVRPFNTIGPRQIGDYGMVVPRFVKQALRGEVLTVYGDGRQTRSFIYVGDTVRALIELSKTKNAIGEIFNIGNPEEISIYELAQKIIEITGSSSKIEFIPYEKAYNKGFEDMPRRVPDISKINKLIGFTPRVVLDDALRLIVEHHKSVYSS